MGFVSGSEPIPFLFLFKPLNPRSATLLTFAFRDTLLSLTRVMQAVDT